MGFFRQAYCSELPFPPPGDLPHPGTEPTSPVSLALQADSLPTEPPGKPGVPNSRACPNSWYPGGSFASVGFAEGPCGCFYSNSFIVRALSLWPCAVVSPRSVRKKFQSQSLIKSESVPVVSYDSCFFSPSFMLLLGAPVSGICIEAALCVCVHTHSRHSFTHSPPFSPESDQNMGLIQRL